MDPDAKHPADHHGLQNGAPAPSWRRVLACDGNQASNLASFAAGLGFSKSALAIPPENALIAVEVEESLLHPLLH